MLCGKLQFFLPVAAFGRRSHATLRGVVENSVFKIILETRDFSVVFVPIFGRFRPDFNMRAQDRAECRCRWRGTPPRRDADCASQWRFPRPRACATPSTFKWVDIWRIDGLLFTRKLSEMGVLCGKLQFLLHRLSYPSLPLAGAQMRRGEG